MNREPLTAKEILKMILEMVVNLTYFESRIFADDDEFDTEVSPTLSAEVTALAAKYKLPALTVTMERNERDNGWILRWKIAMTYAEWVANFSLMKNLISQLG